MKMSERLNHFRTNATKCTSNKETAMKLVKGILAKRREAKAANPVVESTNPNANMANIDYDFVSKRNEQRVLINVETKNGSTIEIECDTTQLNTLALNRALNALSAI